MVTTMKITYKQTDNQYLLSLDNEEIGYIIYDNNYVGYFNGINDDILDMIINDFNITYLDYYLDNNKYHYAMGNKAIVNKFFMDGYVNHNYQFIKNCLADDYFDHSPANARSNYDAINILKIVEGQFSELKITMLDLFEEDGMVATRVLYEGIHSGECMGISATGRLISFEALENFKVVNNKIVESWGYWPDNNIEYQLTK